MKRAVLRMAAVLLLVLAAGWYAAVAGRDVMNNTAFAIERPPVDRVIPVKLETATFALG